jgi:hypothetical protein
VGRYEIEVLPWAINDARETYLYLLERDERLADEFQRRVSEPCVHSLIPRTTTRLARTTSGAVP